MALSPPGKDASGAAKFLWLYFGFRGSIGRREYRLANLLILACYIAAFRLVRQIDLPGWLSGSLSNLSGVVALAALWCVFALAAKRVHDLGFPTPVALLVLLPPFLPLVVIWLSFAKPRNRQ